MKKGFTLLEILIATAISSLIALGLFAMFSSIVGSREESLERNENVGVVQALTKLINKDIRMTNSGAITIDSSGDIEKLKFSTQNSLRFNKSMPVEIQYYIDDEGWFVRRETNTDLLFDMEMRIVPDVTELEYEFYDGIEYDDEVKSDANLMKIHLTINENVVTVLAARVF